ncbi:MAG: hypothetical protein HZA53_09955 [Planctomycetes bacterium]|nr:hypothetical protein [Planctomycetota bacterium]
MKTKLLLSVAALAIALPAAFAQDSKPAPQKKPAELGASAAGVAPAQGAEQAVIAAEKPSYPLATCPVSGEKLGAGAVDRVFGGHLVRLCCKDCAAEVEKDPAASRQKVVAAVIQAQKASYPLTTCAVTAEALGANAVDHVLGTRLVRLKDKDAVATFEKKPAEFMAKVDKALIEAQLPKYAVAACPVTGEALDKNAVNYLYGTKLVRLCCKGCIKKFEAAPEKFLAELAKTK